MKRFLCAALIVAAVAAGAFFSIDRISQAEARCQRLAAEIALWESRLDDAVCQLDQEREQFGRERAKLEAEVARLKAEPPVILEVEVARTARVLNLPEDGDKWFTTLILDAHFDTLPDPKQRAAQVEALKMFNTEPWCLELRQQTHWNVFKTDDPRARPLFPIVPQTPCLLLQRACGEVIYKESGPQLSKGAEGLRKALKRATRRHCPDGRCPVSWPTPKPNEQPKVEPVPAVIDKPALPEKPAAILEPKKEPDLVPTAIVGALSFITAIAVRLRIAMQS